MAGVVRDVRLSSRVESFSRSWMFLVVGRLKPIDGPQRVVPWTKLIVRREADEETLRASCKAGMRGQPAKVDDRRGAVRWSGKGVRRPGMQRLGSAAIHSGLSCLPASRSRCESTRKVGGKAATCRSHGRRAARSDASLRSSCLFETVARMPAAARETSGRGEQ